MGKVTFKVNYSGVGALLKSSEMQNVLARYGDQVMSKLPAGYEMEISQTEERAKVRISAKSYLARLDNSKNNTLLKALGGGK